MLDKRVNYIVSGLERSGTSLLMQILNEGKIPISYDNKRPPDQFNPKGYFELEGGKIINKIANKNFSFDKYTGKFIKITSYGIKFLPPGKYKILYSERNYEEIVESMEKMTGKVDSNKKETMENIEKLNRLIKKEMKNRIDINFITINYNDTILNPEKNIKKILDFLNLPKDNIENMVNAVDLELYNPIKDKTVLI
jgi:hypothetical protein